MLSQISFVSRLTKHFSLVIVLQHICVIRFLELEITGFIITITASIQFHTERKLNAKAIEVSILLLMETFFFLLSTAELTF
jgi:hypothetical protein